MNCRPIIPQPRPARPQSNHSWVMQAFIFECLLLSALLLWWAV